MTSRRPTSRHSSGDESPFQRWSRRKHAAREQEQVTAPGEPEAEPDEASTTASARATPNPPAGDSTGSAEIPDDELPTDADMPPIESLDADSDYSPFMSPRVSQSLRRMALRKLFGTAGFNVRDGLDDYDEDFTRYQSLGDAVTADMKYQAERRARLAATQDQAEHGGVGSEGASEPADTESADEADTGADVTHETPEAAAQREAESAEDNDEESRDELG